MDSAQLTLRLRRASYIFELVNRVVVRTVGIVPDLEDADRAIGDVAVLIELDVALEGIQVRDLDGIPHRMPIYRLSGSDYRRIASRITRAAS